MFGKPAKGLVGAALIASLAAAMITVPWDFPVAYATSPAAGSCSNSTGELICNVSGEQLDFSQSSAPAELTQTSSSTNVDIGVGLSLGSVIRYEEVFRGDDGTVVDALVTVDALPGNTSGYILDSDRADAEGIKPIDVSNLQGTLSVEVVFINDNDDSVKLQNLQVVTKDIDLADGEAAQFSGLASYSLSSGSHIQVDDSTAGVRRFTSSANVGMTDEKGWVSVTFPTTSAVGLTANISSTGRSIPFDFDSRTVWTTSPTITAVAAASHTVSFDLDGGSGSTPTAVSGSGELTFPAGAGQSKNGVNIAGWTALSGGSGARVALGGTYTPISDTTFYAVYDGASVGSPSTTSGTVGEAFSSTLSTSGFASSDLTFTIGSGSLPAGLSLNSSTGAITGTPTAAGDQSLTVTATHSGGGSATSSSFTLSIAMKAAPPIVAAHDAFVQPGDANGATSSTLLLKNAVNNPASTYNRVSYARFEFDPAYNWTNAAFEMMVTSNADGASNNGYNRSYTTFNVDVWAMSDASWDDSLRFSSANASVQDWGIDTSTWPWNPNGGTYIGTISIPTLGSTVGQTYSLSNATLASFLNADADGEVTLFFRRSDLDNQGNLSFASIENSTPGYHGPRLVAPSGSYSYTIAYDVNGGSGTLPSPGTYTVGLSAYTVAAPSSVTPPSGKTFSGWNSKADGSGPQYSVGSSYSTAASATLYAQFTTNPVVTFASNDGASVSAYQAVTSGTATALTSNAFTRTGYTFGGWNTAANGSGTSYADGANITTSTAVTLYAQWTSTSSGSSGGSSSSTVGSDDDEEVTPAPLVTPTVTRPTVRLPFPTPTPPRPAVLSAPVKTPTSVSTPVDRLVSRIGGVPAPVTTSTNGDDELSVSTSSMRLSLKMSQQASVSESSDASAELTIKPGAKAAVTATGLLPNTTLQVWLPNVTERELGRLSVNAAGEITGELGLSSNLGEEPLPIGRQTLQMTGYDADGNQTVVEMPVNIAQGPPTPEPNRQEGALPELGTGQSLATSAGVPTPTTVSVLQEQNAVSVTGDGWGINMNIPAVSGTVEDDNGQPVIRLVQSSMASMSGSGMQPGTVASVWFFSEPTCVGTVAVAEDGSFTLDVMVDAHFIPAGNHTVQVQGVGPDGYIKSVNMGVLVDEPAAETTASSAMVMLWWALAAAAVIALIVVILVSRRRRQA